MRQAPVFIVNPKSHGVHMKGSVLSRIAVDFGDIPIVDFDGGGSLSNQLIPLLLEGRDTVYVEGGDGTVVAALTSCFESLAKGAPLPRIAVLPGGSTNLIHKQLGIRMLDPEEIKRSINAGRRNGPAENTTHHQALMVQTSESHTPYVGFLLSTGSLARLMIYAQRNLHGKTRGAVSIIRAIFQLALFTGSTKFSDGLPVMRPSEFATSTQNGSSKSSEETFSLFSTLDELSLGLSPFWGRGDSPIGHTQAAWPIRRLRLGIAKALLGGSPASLQQHGLSSRGCSAITFRTDGPILLDGEELPMPRDRTFEISISPRLEFIR